MESALATPYSQTRQQAAVVALLKAAELAGLHKEGAGGQQQQQQQPARPQGRTGHQVRPAPPRPAPPRPAPPRPAPAPPAPP